MRLSAGVHQGPLVLDHAQTLIGEEGAVVRGGIVITADDVTVRDLTVRGGEHGIEVDDADSVELDGSSSKASSWTGSTSAAVRSRSATAPSARSRRAYVQGIDISFGFDKAPSLVEGCTVTGGLEGIVTHFAPRARSGTTTSAAPSCARSR